MMFTPPFVIKSLLVLMVVAAVLLAGMRTTTWVDLSSSDLRVETGFFDLTFHRRGELGPLRKPLDGLGLAPGAPVWEKAYERRLWMRYNPLAYRKDFRSGGASSDYRAAVLRFETLAQEDVGSDSEVRGVIAKWGGAPPKMKMDTSPSLPPPK